MTPIERKAWEELLLGDIIEDGDEFWSATSNEWKAANRIGVKIGTHDHHYRRPVKATREPAAPTDREMLDWLEKNREYVIGFPAGYDHLWFIFFNDYEVSGPTLRAAIAAAMKLSPQQPSENQNT